MKLYRIKHIPTGLYWRNSRSGPGKGGRCRDQLTSVGRVYTSMPDLRWIFHGGDRTVLFHNGENRYYLRSDFEIEEFESQ